MHNDLFFQSPNHRRAHVLIVYRNFGAAENSNNQCHVGLGVGALHTVRTLRKEGVDARAAGVWTPDQIRKCLYDFPHVTHCIIEAPWVPVADTERLLGEFPGVHFLVRCHSQIGFLQVEAGAISILRDLLVLQDGVLNLTVASNSQRLRHFLEKTYGSRCLYLPNLYDLERVGPKRVSRDRDILRVGSFGAIRLLKNHTTAASAALCMARERGTNLEVWISVNREEGGAGVVDALRAMFKGLHWARLVEHPWEDWAHFRRTVGYMDLVIQASMTETFNIVTADACAEGVPAVVTPMIEWAPSYWHCDPDDIEQMARVGLQLLSNRESAADGLRALEQFVRHATWRWLAYLDGQPDGQGREI